jgi:AcrR family transcriptional regulator
LSDTDRRVARTQTALWAALMALLRETDWGRIGVQTICDRANIGRSTFYAHFATKQALLDWGFDQEGAAIRDQVLALAGTLPPDRLATVDWLVTHMAGAKGFLRHLAASPSGYVIQDRFRRALREVLGTELARRGHSLAPLRLTFLSGGLFAALDDALAKGASAETLIPHLSAELLFHL